MREKLNLKAQDANALRDFAQEVRALLGPQLIELKLFGSKVRGEDLPNSDIDVAVIVKESSPKLRDQVLDAAFEVNLAHDVYISPRVIGQAVLEDPVWRITPFLEAVEKEGVLL